MLWSQRMLFVAVIFASFAPALQAQPAPITSCTSDSPEVGNCEAVLVVPWVPVSNTELIPGDLANGIIGPGWKAVFSFSNVTKSAVGVNLDLLDSNTGAYITPGVLCLSDSGDFGIAQTIGPEFPVNPGQTRTMTFLSAANYSTASLPNGVWIPGTPNSTPVNIVMHIRYYATDLPTLNQILNQGSVSIVLYQVDPTSGQLVARWSSVVSPRSVDQLTNNAYTNVAVTPLAFLQANAPAQNVAFAVQNTSFAQQMINICLTRSDGRKFPCIPQVIGPMQARAFMLDAFFGPQTFTNGNVSLFQGKLTVTSADKVALFVLQVVGDTASGSPWWSY